MKKILAVAASLILVVVSANSQSEKKEPPPPPAPDGINNQKYFLKRNPEISTVNWRSGKQKTIILKFKSGTEEQYDLTNETEQKNFVGKYGAVPMQPPPPPPPRVNITKFKPPTITAKGDKAEDFYKRNPSVTEISRQGNIIILKMKDGTKQEYNINKKDDMKSFTDQYGESPLPPPPPAPPKQKTKA